ncbi:uncharacterized protein EV420DRAFT_1477791 [Desarmillaria tabescens]|uniref:Uncharacterized protein n=1 Tax=Armillaria tabescens TaxID=1929756 RepID=A0AA39TVJ2_ARMTA|nr:uncharacterized protein EV420DRAFT_1477791 [Desarmillaria tabescens]KAK0460905.1 hypothetical protein EV420DRAFT_1477791 [Desarmillaria tabescens]
MFEGSTRKRKSLPLVKFLKSLKSKLLSPAPCRLEGITLELHTLSFVIGWGKNANTEIPSSLCLRAIGARNVSTGTVIAWECLIWYHTRHGFSPRWYSSPLCGADERYRVYLAFVGSGYKPYEVQKRLPGLYANLTLFGLLLSSHTLQVFPVGKEASAGGPGCLRPLCCDAKKIAVAAAEVSFGRIVATTTYRRENFPNYILGINVLLLILLGITTVYFWTFWY